MGVTVCTITSVPFLLGHMYMYYIKHYTTDSIWFHVSSYLYVGYYLFIIILIMLKRTFPDKTRVDNIT